MASSLLSTQASLATAQVQDGLRDTQGAPTPTPVPWLHLLLLTHPGMTRLLTDMGLLVSSKPHL